MTRTRKALLALLGLALVKAPADVLLAATLPDASVNPVPQLGGGMLASLLLLGLPAWLLRPWRSVRLKRAESLWPGLLTAACLALLTRAAMTPVDAVWQSWLGLTPDALPVPDGVLTVMLYIAALVIVPACTEEAFFRGALLTGLLDGVRRWAAVLLTTAAFVLMHGSAANLPSLLAVSLLLTLLMLHTGHIAVPVTAHLVYNLTALKWGGVPLWGSVLCGAALVALAAYGMLPRTKNAHPPTKWQDGLIAAAALAVLLILYFI